MKKLVKPVALLMAVLLGTLTGCGASGTASGTATGEAAAASADSANSIVLAQSSEVANLNPMIQPRTPDSNVQCLIFDYLVVPDENLNYVGDLAKSWDISEDGTVYTFHLNEGVKWHDGEDFTADDVVFTLTSLASPTYTGGSEGRVMAIQGAAEYQAGEADSVSGIQKIDDYTVQLTLTSPNAAFLADMYVPILPEHVLGDEDPGQWGNDDFNRAPIGTGKYKFVEWQPGQYITLVRNEDYFGTKPSIENVVVRFGADTTLVAALLNGEVDVLYNLPSTEIENVEAVTGASVYNYEQMSVYYIGLNFLDPALSDVRVRQALAYALDKQTIVSTVYGETATVANDVFPDNHWSHNPDVTVYSYDPEKAKSLLEEAGYTMNDSTGIYEKDGKPLHLTFDMSTSTDGRQVAALVQQYWKAVGVDMEVIEEDFATLAYSKLLPDNGATETTADSFQCYMLGFDIESDPNEYNDYFTTSTGAGSWNFIHYSNPEVDQLFEQQLLETDADKRADCFHQISKILSDDEPWIPLYSHAVSVGLSDRVQNYVADYRGTNFQIEKWTLAE